MDRLERLSARLAGTWAFEVAALITSICSLITLVAVLVVTDGKNVKTWHHVTLNTTVSVLSTICRLSALYVFSAAIAQTKWIAFSHRPGSLLEFEAIDLASQGPVGCFQLLFRTRKIAIIGPLAVIATLAFDPFAQQLVRLRSSVEFVTNLNATIPVAQVYDEGYLSYGSAREFDENGLLPVNVDAGLGMQSAVLRGLTQSELVIDGQLPLQCASGNCTWSSVQSLAVCSICNDVTYALQRSISTGENAPAGSLLSNENLTFASSNTTTYTLADQVFLNNADGFLANNTYNILSMAAYGTGDPARTTSLKESDTLIWAMGIIRATPNATLQAKWPQNFVVNATECGLYYCVNEYSVELRNNKVNGTTREVTSAKRDPNSWQYLMVVERSDLSLQNNNDSFNISQAAVLSVNYYMNKTFTRADTQPYDASDTNNALSIGAFYISDESPARYNGGGANDQREPSIMQSLHDSTDLNSTFAALATSMSTAIRSNPAGSRNERGELGQLITTYRISWPWIALPAIVVIASVIQLLVTVLSNRHSPLWKSNIIATLSRGYMVGDLLRDAHTIDDFRVAADKQDVYLFDKVGEDWRGPTMKRSESLELQEQVPGLGPTPFEKDEIRDSLLNDGR